MSNKVLLVILDGWGHGLKRKADAIALANIPFVNSLYQKYPNSELITYGELVGLPEDQMGNSEVGHMNIGAGRIVYQDLARINKSIRQHELQNNKTLLEAFTWAKKNNRDIHFMGLVSNGGVHSHIAHLKALCDVVKEMDIPQAFIHAFTDGRDTDPKSGEFFITDLINHIKNSPVRLASIIGRYYAMDRDKRWERIKYAYDLLVRGVGEKTEDPVKTIEDRYAKGETDEFLLPIVVTEEDKPIAKIKNGDLLVCFNFRTDRPREISTVLTQQDFDDYDMQKLDLRYLTFTRYDDTFENIEVIFEKQDLSNTLGEILSRNGKTQLRIAETEKYPHVTFFFSGGRETEFDGESRKMIPSPKVATYDLKPEMSAIEMTDAAIEAISIHSPDFICLNYANADMVGHTGIFEAARKAAEVVSENLQRLVEAARSAGYEILITADHGNSDYMINEDGTPNTAHTKNPVPCFYIGYNTSYRIIKNGKLADIAPTILKMFEISPPEEMNGNTLLM